MKTDVLFEEIQLHSVVHIGEIPGYRKNVLTAFLEKLVVDFIFGIGRSMIV